MEGDDGACRRLVAHLAGRVSIAVFVAARAKRSLVPCSRLGGEMAGDALAARAPTAALDGAIEEGPGARQGPSPDAALVGSPPGMGAALTAERIALAGSGDGWLSADWLVAAAGLAPVLRHSVMARGRRAHAGNTALRHVCYPTEFSVRWAF